MSSNIINALSGGFLIGVSVLLLFGLLGRIAGISGILWQSISNRKAFFDGANRWRWSFLIGLVSGPLLLDIMFDWAAPIASDAGPIWAVIGGLLVGFGTRLGSGCTSGHGVCGIGRLSFRSIVATVVFIGAGVITVSVVRLTLA